MERKDSEFYQETIRLNRFLAMAGVGSRRKNDKLILSGVVKVNGQVVQELGSQVQPGKDCITVEGKMVSLTQKLLYILFNKPKDAITTISDEKGRTTVMNYVELKQRVFPVGRLDRNSTGVLLFTNDGEMAYALMHPKFEIEKIYRIMLDRQITDQELKKLRRGVELEDGFAKVRSADIIEGSKRKKVCITLREGRNREVRRIFKALGHEVRQLDRVSFAGLTSLGLSRGRWRFLSREEISHLKQLTRLVN